MIIKHARLIPELNVEGYVWAHLRRYQNVSMVADLITEVQQVPARHKDNVRKQAEQLRYCLQQAEEYYDAARAVSLATRPTLLYYSHMSLALAEILFKQSGDSSLDRARAQHRHHGLTSTIQMAPGGATSLATVAGLMKAEPVVSDTERMGTFELWHRSAREHPIGGVKSESPLTEFRAILMAHDERLPELAMNGVTLLECMRSLDGLVDTVQQNGIDSYVVRGRVDLHLDGEQVTLQVQFHPAPVASWETLCEGIKIRPCDLECMDAVVEHSYGRLRFRYHKSVEAMARFPQAATIGRQEVRFCAKEFGLNEFGLFCVALFILGNYARYYPDRWIKDVEKTNPIAHAAERVMECATERAPLLLLSELERCLLVPGVLK
jgi:hypothetical protein